MIQSAMLQQMNNSMGIQQQQYQNVSPFAKQALALGQGAMNGVVPDSYLAPARQSIASGFQGSRQQLADFLANSGQGMSGLAAGPMANSFNQEAIAQGQAAQQAQQSLINLGFQGANAAQGQQAIFNPAAAGQVGTMNPQQFASNASLIGGSLAGAAIGAAGTAFGKR
jgi:hypothetical protein